MRSRPASFLASVLLLLACNEPAKEVSHGGETGSTSGSSSSSGTPAESTTGSLDTTAGTGSATGSGSSSTSGVLDGTGTSGSSSGPGESSSSESTGPVPVNGCADGEREAFVDEVAYPDIAACAGGWMVPGMYANVPACGRAGGDDGPLPAGAGCSVEDLCSEGWHVCADRFEVMAAGVANCNTETFGNAFFATGQSSMGGHTCSAGVDDVFGCGDIGWDMLNGCAPLNRDSQNLCNALPAPWDCGPSSLLEADFVVKGGPESGGVLCCRN
ncbi:hypothetical protein [Paraliomyxa miuraensis]|uniref:hypothetical protein n=1 Tax=Paraliomyxa miuraensis TaxID=376150 RepID=UPI00224D7CE0|nr:hypothetical protein [Paraliomyxa miuraensis]MCX4244615.1 hypothetical protein [Paraliomyxa miuraensis]